MKLVRHRRPYTPRTYNSIFDNFFNTNLGDFIGSDNVSQSPSVNVLEEDKRFVVELAAPGMSRDDFEVTVEEDILTVSAKRKQEVEESKGNYMRKEFYYNEFSRSFRLPSEILSDDISASYNDGILSIEVPKDIDKQTTLRKTVEIS